VFDQFNDADVAAVDADVGVPGNDDVTELTEYPNLPAP
jgi:hypothetical protein